MEYKMVAFDLDGTLIGDGVHIPESALQAIERLNQHGIGTMVATGRSIYVIPNCLRNNPAMRYYVSASGARLVDMSTGQEVFAGDIPDDKAKQILSISRIYGGRALVFFRNIVVYEKKTLNPRRQAIGENRKAEGAEKLLYADLADDYIGKYGPVEKITLEYDIEHKEKILQDILETGEYEMACQDNVIEISCKGVSKCSGIEYFCEKLGISTNQVVAFGDSENDLSVMHGVGLSVAMGNALPEIQQQAGIVTDHYDNDGIAKGIEKIFGF